MKLFTIMALDTLHIGEICEDIRAQYENGVADCALFEIKLVPEGDPVIDKASIEAEKYILFRDRLEKMGIKCGILVQCTIGHGYPLNHMFPFQRLTDLDGGRESFVVCPADTDARAYYRDQLATLASLKPEVIMIDDDFRLMYRPGKGCGCPLHMKMFNEAAGVSLTRGELFGILKDTENEKRVEYTDIFVETQRSSLLNTARAMREGIDSVDPTIPGVFCSVGHTTEFGAEIAKILAGEGHPTVVRINNGNYTPEGARYLSRVSYRCAQQSDILRRGGVDIILAETDTCPQNRYSTGAQSLHAHFTASILEGVAGAKHWITRLSAFEPKSGLAYRKKLARHRGFYEELSRLSQNIKWLGCRIPLPRGLDYGFTREGWYEFSDAWSSCVLERFGVPIYFSSNEGGAVFLEGDLSTFSDEELYEMCGGTLFVASDSAEVMCRRGFSEYLGVDVKPWTGARTSFERINATGQKSGAQQQVKQIIPLDDSVSAVSTVFHLKDGKEEIPLFPGVTVYDNKIGGGAVVFSGTPRARFVYTEAFSFLNESRKAQMTELLRESGNLPIYYEGDGEVYLKAGYLPSAEMLVAAFNIGLDPIDEITLNCEKAVSKVEYLTEKGEKKPAPYRCENGILTVGLPLYTLEPVVLFLS